MAQTTEYKQNEFLHGAMGETINAGAIKFSSNPLAHQLHKPNSCSA